MGKNRELASIVSNKIWRTVVVAGAMLATPACGGGNKKPTPMVPTGGDTGVRDPKAGDDQKAADEKKAADDKAAADAKTAADAKAAEDARLLAEKEAADKAAKEAADKKAAEDAAAAKKRPRGGGDRPTGRGFILS